MTTHPSAPTPAPDDRSSDPRLREAVVDLLAGLACDELAASGELAADARRAPTLADRVALARLAARRLADVERLLQRLEELGADPLGAMAPFVEAVDAYHARTRSESWPEAVVKAYVGDGIRTDFYREVAAYVDDRTRALVSDVVMTDDARDDALVAAVRAAIEADPAVQGRLALWARRLMGEGLARAQRVAVQREGLADLLVGGVAGAGADLGELGAVVSRMEENHARRMERLGLSA